MWPRTVEVMLALWLGISPFILRISASETAVWANDWICAVLVATFSLAAFWGPLKRARWGTFAVAMWLTLYGWLQPRPLSPADQNHMIIGLLLVMFALIPGDALQPPEPWREPTRDTRT